MERTTEIADVGARPSPFDRAAPDSRGMSFSRGRPMAVSRTLGHDGVGSDAGLQIVSVEGDAITVHDLPRERCQESSRPGTPVRGPGFAGCSASEAVVSRLSARPYSQ